MPGSIATTNINMARECDPIIVNKFFLDDQLNTIQFTSNKHQA